MRISRKGPFEATRVLKKEANRSVQLSVSVEHVLRPYLRGITSGLECIYAYRDPWWHLWPIALLLILASAAWNTTYEPSSKTRSLNGPHLKLLPYKS